MSLGVLDRFDMRSNKTLRLYFCVSNSRKYTKMFWLSLNLFIVKMSKECTEKESRITKFIQRINIHYMFCTSMSLDWVNNKKNDKYSVWEILPPHCMKWCLYFFCSTNRSLFSLNCKIISTFIDHVHSAVTLTLITEYFIKTEKYPYFL